MKKIASFVALVLISVMSFAGSIGAPASMDFGTYNIYGQSELMDSLELTLNPSGISDYGIGVEVVDDADGIFWPSDSWLYANGTPDYHGVKKAKVYFYVIETGVYTAKLRLTDYNTSAYEDVALKVTIVNNKPVVATFTKVTTTSDLNVDDTIVFACESAGAVGGPLYETYLPAVTANVKFNTSDKTLEVPEATVQMFRLAKNGSDWQFWTVEATPKRLHLNTTGKGSFTYADTEAGVIFANWGISISSGSATVSKADGTWPVSFNSNRFKPYATAQGSTTYQIYKKKSASGAESKFETNPTSVAFGEMELAETKSIDVAYTAEYLLADITWKLEGTDASLFELTQASGNTRTSGTVTVRYKGAGSTTGAKTASLTYATKDADNKDLKGSVPVSITLTPNTVHPTGLAIEQTSPQELVVGKTLQLTTAFTPSTTTNKQVTWESNKPTIASVSETGLVTALKYDQYNNNVTITAKSVKDPTITAQITVNVVLPPVTDVQLNKTETSLYVGGTETLIATILPEGAYQKVTWSTSDKKIATVSTEGVVTGVAIGDVEIKATSSANSAKYATCTVHVIKTPVESVAFSPNSKELAVGGTYQLSPVVTPSAAASQYTASYESSKTSVATVSETGLVTAVAEGTAEITCTIGGKSGKITITVVGAKFFTKVTDASTLKAKDTIILAVAGGAGTDAYAIVAGARNTDKKALSVIKEGVTITADAAAADQALQFVLGEATGGFTLTPVGSSTAIAIGTSNDIVNASASNNKVWEFLADGTNGIYVHNTGTNTNGYGYLKYHISNNVIKAYKTTTTGAVYVYVYVRPYAEPVKPAVTGVSLDQTEYSTHVGDAAVTLKATVTPNDADQEIVWTSSNEAIATVNASGKVVPKSVGDVTITAKAKTDETKYATCLVHVIAWTVEYVEFNYSGDLTIEVGETVEDVQATAYPTGHGFKVDYYTSNENIATVTIGGKITGVAEGDAVITAKSGDKEATLNVHVTAKAVPEEKGAISVADFLKAKDDFNIYTLTGWVTNIKEDSDGVPYKKGEFTLNDATGSIAIYGILTPAGVADKFWEMDIEEKDTVTLKGSYDEYKGTPQIKNATLVEVKKYVEPVDPTAIDAVRANKQATKVIREGQVIIIREEKEFDVVGRRVK